MGIAKAPQSHYTSQASRDPEVSPNASTGLRHSSSSGFEIMNDLDLGDISDGMTVEAATDSHLELEDWSNLNLAKAMI